jgi:type II secretion system protein I
MALTRELPSVQRVDAACARQLRSLCPADATGFTLLEVMVALAIVAIVLVPLLRLHLLSLDATIRAQDLTTAVLLAQGQMSLLPPFPEPGEEQGTFEAQDLARFRWHSAVTEQELILDATAQLVQLRQIEVTVSWVDGRREHHYTLQTYAAK